MEEISGQEIQPHGEQSSGPSLPGSSRMEVTIDDQSNEPVIAGDADDVGRTELPEMQKEARDADFCEGAKVSECRTLWGECE